MMRWTAVLICLLLSACGGGREKPVDTAMGEGRLIRGNGKEPESLDPHLASSVSAGNVLVNLFEGLTRLNPESLEPEAAMAESWTVSEDGLVWEFQLRTASWSDGQALTAEDFAFAFRRLLHPDLGASYAFMLFPLKGAEARSKGELEEDELGVKALGEKRLQLTLEQPTAHLPSLLAHWTAFPLPQHVVEKHGSVSERDNPWTRPENIVSNGAFLLESWEPENRIVVKKNEAYWQADTVELLFGEFRPYGDAGAEERAFRSGEIHVTYTLPRHRLRYYRDQQAPELRVDPYLESVAYIYNVNQEVLQDVRVRQALSLALDRGAVTRQVLYDVREPATSYVPPGCAGYKPPAGVSENLTRARELLDEAGYPGGKGFPELELIFPSGQDTVRVAEVLQQLWQQRLGIRVTLSNLERKLYFEKRKKGEFDLCYLGWVGDYPDPRTFLDLWRSSGGNNLAGWVNADYDRLLNESERSEDRMATLAEAERLLLEELPVLPLYFGATQYLKDTRVQGWTPNLLDQHPLRVLRFQTDSP